MIPIFKPYMPEGVYNGINEILYSGKLSYGKHGKTFEKELSRYIKHKNVLTTTTYNQAMLIVLSTLQLKKGDEVIASPVSCLASNQPFATKGLKVVWGDVDPNTGSLCVEDIRSKITQNTKAIFHNHFCGYLGSIKDMNDLGKEFGIPIVDDCIEAFGSELDGKKTGNLGTDVTVFSFNSVRLPNTINGGAIIFENEELYMKARMIRDYGIDRKNFRDHLDEINPDFDVKLEGYGALMSEINSFIGISQLSKIEELISHQRQNSAAWTQIISKRNNHSSLKVNQGTLPNNWVHGTLAKDKLATIKEFRKKGFYATAVHFNNNAYSVFGERTELKGVKDFMNHYVALPSGWWFKKTYNEH